MDEDELDEWANILGITPEDVEDLIDAGVDLDAFGFVMSSAELEDYLSDMADILDIDVSYLYDMYYGYAPGASE